MLLKPLTMALDILQGEEKCFYGTILPTLEALMATTLDLKGSLSQMTSGLPDVIVEVQLFVHLLFYFCSFRKTSFTKNIEMIYTAGFKLISICLYLAGHKDTLCIQAGQQEGPAWLQ